MTNSMNERDAAARLRDILRGIRAAKPDARSFALFEKRDDLAALGVPYEQTDAFDANDDAALDRLIGQAAAVARDLGADDEWAAMMGGEDETTVAATRPPGTGLVGGLANLGNAVKGAVNDVWNGDVLARPRLGSVKYDKLPATYDYSSLNDQFSGSMAKGEKDHREIFHAIQQRPSGRWSMTKGATGNAVEANASAMDSPFVQGAHHTHDNTQIDNKTGKPFTGGAVSGGDAAGLMKSGAKFSIAQAGKQQTMFVRTDLTPRLSEEERDRLTAQHERRARQYYEAGRSWDEATMTAAMDTAAKYGLGLYKGEGGVFKRVPIGYGSPKRR